MTLVELEAWSSRECELSQAEAAAVAGAGLVDVAAEPSPGRWRLSAGSRVGVAVGPAWEIRVRPRIRAARLLFLLGYATDPAGWRDERATFEVDDDLFVAIANGFAYHALRLLDQGLLHGYVDVEERLAGVRGRIRFADQIARSGLPLPVEVSYDDFTVDVEENRMLKSATLALLSLPRIPVPTRRRLLKLRSVLDRVGTEPRPQEVSLPRFTRLNERYRPALRLAWLILRSASIGERQGPVDSVAYVFDMNRVFEDFLAIALREALARHGGEVRFQWATALDAARQVQIRPDVVWLRGGRVRAVVDAKHKEAADGGVPSGDVYQMLAYCTALRLQRGYLVYAKGVTQGGAELAVLNSHSQICVRSVDLEQSPDRLLTDIGALADEIAA